ncbi:MAG: hypothetical protein M1835_001049 [Candelina submexicana]|nr:MAG: hypothetical protein M1835_001049 [Candelina submexicana]
MVQLDIVRSCNADLVKTQPLVAVFVGGTSGIGEFAIRSLAAVHGKQGKGLRLYIVGRNSSAAEKTISECKGVCPQGDFRFVKAKDLALLNDVDRVCDEIIRIEKDIEANGGFARVDLLVTSQHYFPLTFEPRSDTPEGLDTSISLLYYSRMRFVIKLLPLLLASKLPAHIVSIFAAGKESNTFPEDLSLRDPKHYGAANARSHVVHMTTFFMENLAKQYRGRLSLTHAFPGLVITEAFNDARLPAWFRIVWRIASPIARLFALSGEEIGERILFLASPRYPARQEPSGDVKYAQASATGGKAGVAMGTDGNPGSGAYAVNWDGEPISTAKAYKRVRAEGLSEKVWDHTMKAFEEIEAGRTFKG